MEELKAARAHSASALTPEEIAIAKANLRFALENCPVDGGVLTEDGCSFSSQSVEVLLGRLEELKSTPLEGRLAEDELEVMRAVADYALDECPVEGGLARDDGSLVLRSDLLAYRKRIARAAMAEVG